ERAQCLTGAANLPKATVQSSELVTYAIRSAVLNETELSWLIDNDLTKALLSVPGVGQVNRIGGVDREVHVDLDPTTMAAFGV
ncbi:efflux RND transporter permease subunit, partial [Rhizobium johnstonii]|uniref:efflux RND transporter permease subunit n=1 Tax=Rhizobium johnstonii TaxID=3019933 RepID=UPI003F9AC497